MKEIIRKFYADEATTSGGYGYTDDTVKQNPFNFGLNAGVTKLVKFEWIPNGGKGGAEQEALDIVFNINGTDKSARRFPVTHGFGKNQEKITDPNSPEFKGAMSNHNAYLVHIVHAFVDKDAIQAALSRPISNFKEHCQILMSILPKDYKEIPLDIFLQYQWQTSEGQDKTYLDIPNKMSNGRWLTKAIPGTWTEQRAQNIQESTKKALWYTNEKGEEHEFFRNGWFMLSNFGNQQKSGSAATNQAAGQAMNAGTAANSQATEGAKKSAW